MKKLFVLSIFISLLLCSCGYDLYEIQTHETAFLIPLEGKTSDQAKFDSAKMVNELKVSAKRVKIEKDYKWMHGNKPMSKLVKVNRKPVNREWTEEDKTGSSKKNQAFIAESNESTSFYARFSCTCNIIEKDAALYLYTYPSNIKLSKIMDTEIRTRIGGAFIDECGKYNMSEIIKKKSDILKSVKSIVIPYFKKKGITISSLEYCRDFSYLDEAIQKAIDEKFKAKNSAEAQAIKNKKNIEKAEADRRVVEQQKATLAKTIQLRKLEIQEAWIKKWDGKLSTYQGSSGSIMQIPIK
jgi:hypothetical protein